MCLRRIELDYAFSSAASVDLGIYTKCAVHNLLHLQLVLVLCTKLPRLDLVALPSSRVWDSSYGELVNTHKYEVLFNYNNASKKARSVLLNMLMKNKNKRKEDLQELQTIK